MMGVLASTEVNPAGADGLISGNTDFFVAQVSALVLACIWAFTFTYGMLWGIDNLTPVRVTEETERNLDESLHGESAYTE